MAEKDDIAKVNDVVQCLSDTHPSHARCPSASHVYFPIEEEGVERLIPVCLHHAGVMRAKYGVIAKGQKAKELTSLQRFAKLPKWKQDAVLSEVGPAEGEVIH